MTHEEIRHKLSEFIDGAITPGDKAAIEQHLKTCTECSEALRELRKTIEHIHAVEEVDSPAWMTQKIMAKVRTEQEAKKSLWQRVFAPFLMKFPVQAVAVLFLAVTAYYIYSNINPSQKYTEEPVGMLAKKEAPAFGRMKEEDKTVRETAPEAKQDSGKPGYKSLDMKYEYEKPAPPVPQDRMIATAPAPAKQADQAMTANDAYSMDKRALSPIAAAPMMAEQAAPSAGLAGKSERQKEVSSVRQLKAKEFAGCLSYEPAIVTVTGIIDKKDFPGRPNYQNVKKGDERETYWILILDHTTCTLENNENEPEPAIAEIQLVLDEKQYTKFRAYLAKPVSVKGTLFHAHSGHHHTSVLLTVQDVQLREK